MFKKFGAPPLAQPEREAAEKLPQFTSELLSTFQTPSNDILPETTIAQGVHIKGSLRFEKVLRIDGFFEGEIISSGTVIVGPTGVVISHLDLEEAFISGKVVGNITVKKQLSLRGRAVVEGDIRAPRLSVDEGVSLKGNLQIANSTSTDEEIETFYSSDN